MEKNSPSATAENQSVRREEVSARLRQRPFQPFRVHLTDGRVFDIRYPDMNLVSTSLFIIGIPEPNEPDPFADHFVYVDWPLIRQIEGLSESPQTSN